MIKLDLIFKDSVLKQIETDKSEVTIGRGNNNDIIIDNLAVSKEHAAIVKLPDGYGLVDLGSTNGTLLNDKDIKKASLAPQDKITVGKHTLQIRSIDEGKATVEDLADKTVKVTSVK
jgi:pSer/pThr/pTyr-binding forkhead associated (FHA) protein